MKLCIYEPVYRMKGMILLINEDQDRFWREVVEDQEVLIHLLKNYKNQIIKI